MNVPPFLCVVLWQQGAPSRLGLAVSARFGTAVERNLLKRWIRMVFRQTWPRFYAGWQVVVVPRAKAAQVGYQDVVRVFGKLSGLLAQQTLRTG